MSTKKKKTISKDELRRLMKEKKASVKDSSTRINHPLAKYNALDQLVCTLCNNVIKSHLLWTPHLQSRQHKERLALKSQSGPARPAYPIKSDPVKRKASFENSITSYKKQKDTDNSSKLSKGLPAGFFDNATKENSSSPKNSLGLGSYSSSSDEHSDEEERTSSSKSVTHPSLPANFFDPGIKKEEPQEEVKIKTMADILPEGFFDNPKADAKVRQVEYKDKMDEEWEMFQRAMKEENHVSEAIMDEEDEIVNVERNIDEIDDQMNRWKEINDLEIKKEKIMEKKSNDNTAQTDSEDDLDETDLAEFLNWRSKKPL